MERLGDGRFYMHGVGMSINSFLNKNEQLAEGGDPIGSAGIEGEYLYPEKRADLAAQTLFYHPRPLNPV